MVAFLACHDIIERSLSESEMKLLAPVNALQTASYQQTFWWEEQHGALGYRLQIASPSFDSISKIIIDTLVMKDKFIYTLEPGNYEWRVRAENGSSRSAYGLRKLMIHPSSLKEQVLQVISPLDAGFVLRDQVSFSWLGLFGAERYRIQLDDHNFLDEKNLIVDATTDNLSFVYSLDHQGRYQWRIRAENGSENSKWSSVRTFEYDTTGPDKVQLLLPANRQLVSLPVSLQWATSADVNQYELFVFKSDSVTRASADYPKKINASSHAFSAGQSGETLLWRVRGIDKAGNAGIMSDFRSFTLQ